MLRLQSTYFRRNGWQQWGLRVSDFGVDDFRFQSLSGKAGYGTEALNPLCPPVCLLIFFVLLFRFLRKWYRAALKVLVGQLHILDEAWYQALLYTGLGLNVIVFGLLLPVIHIILIKPIK